MTNPILQTDSYKLSHYLQYPPGTQNVYSYFESRGGAFPTTTFFGLQYILKNYLVGKVFSDADIKEAYLFAKAHFFGNADLFNEAGWRSMLNKYDGRLPLTIKAVPEGTNVGTRNVLMTVEASDPEFFWLTNYFETLLVQTWYPTTVATQSRAMKQTLLTALAKSGDPGLIDFKLHDFGYRGSTSEESAAIGGMSHLVNFKGTDTIAGALAAMTFYSDLSEQEYELMNEDELWADQMPGYSIPAAEHSTITSWGRDHEADAFLNMLKQYPAGFVAVVSDSFNIYDACSNLWGEQLKDQVMGRKGTLVARPDSGDPLMVVPKILELLWSKFGGTTNTKGYRVLNDHIRVIQGDGIDRTSLGNILDAVMASKFSADNIAFGSGGGLLQKVDRDTCKFAFKCSDVTINGAHHDVFKQPITDAGKNSKSGRLMLIKKADGTFETINTTEARAKTAVDQLVTVFKDGELLVDQRFEEIRARASANLLI